MAEALSSNLTKWFSQPYLVYLIIQYSSIPGPLDPNSQPELIQVHLTIMSIAQRRRALKSGLQKDQLAVVKLLTTKFKLKLQDWHLDLACQHNSVQVIGYLGQIGYRFTDWHLNEACQKLPENKQTISALIDAGVQPNFQHLVAACQSEALDLVQDLWPEWEIKVSC